MYQESELINVIMAVISVLFLWGFRRIGLPLTRPLLAAYGALLCGQFFTVAEGFVLPQVLNVAEHLSYTVAGILFAVGTARLPRSSAPAGEARSYGPDRAP